MLHLLTSVLATVDLTLKLFINLEDKDLYDLKIEIRSLLLYANHNSDIWKYDLKVHDYNNTGTIKKYKRTGAIIISSRHSSSPLQPHTIIIKRLLSKNNPNTNYKMTFYIYPAFKDDIFWAEINADMLINSKELNAQATKMSREEALDYCNNAFKSDIEYDSFGSIGTTDTNGSTFYKTLALFIIAVLICLLIIYIIS